MTPILRVISASQGPPSDIALGISTSIGRMEHNQLSFPEDLLMSRQHALIRQQSADEFVLIDLGSSNGTFVNSQLLVAPTPLKHEDEITIGSMIFQFCFPEQDQCKKDGLPEEILTETVVGIRVVDVVIMVCDIRNFTRLSEILSPEKVARFLGVWFREVSSLISDSGGVVDKYIGDSFLAYWPVGEDDPGITAKKAIEIAEKIFERVQTTTMPQGVGLGFSVCIGIHEGNVASGNVGSHSQRDSSITGDTVNTAFRLETACKETGYALLVSGEVYERVRDSYQFDSLGPVALKGKQQPVPLYGRRGYFHDCTA